MKFRKIKMKKTVELMDKAKKKGLDQEMILKDLALGRKAAGLFAELSVFGQNTLLVSCFDSAAEARGITPSEYLDELRELYKKGKKKDGR